MLSRARTRAILRVCVPVLATAGLLGAPHVEAAQGFLTCASNNYRYQYCHANTQGRAVLLREVSTGNLCRQGRGWGFDNNGIWVDKGCRGEFSYGRDDRWSGGGGGGLGGGGSGGRGSGTITCESIGYRYRYCNADTQGRVSLAREISTGNLCRQGTGWGHDRGGIWVDRGCRGEFRYGNAAGRSRDDAAIAAGILGALAIGAAIGANQSQPAAPPPPPPTPPANRPPPWSVGSFHAYDPDSGDIVQLIVAGDGHVYLRNEVGQVINEGDLREGMVYWRDGNRSWFAREGPAVLLGDVNSGRHFYFNPNQ